MGGGNTRAPTYREWMRFSAFREWVSQRSVRASSSARSCSQVSLLGAPIKPVGTGKEDMAAVIYEGLGGLSTREGEWSYLEVSNQRTPKVSFTPVISILFWDCLIDPFIQQKFRSAFDMVIL